MELDGNSMGLDLIPLQWMEASAEVGERGWKLALLSKWKLSIASIN